jgi:hypothetical protein
MAGESKRKEHKADSGNISIRGDVGAGAAVGAGASVKAQNIAGRDMTVGVSAGEAADAFAKIYQAVEAKRSTDPQTAEAAKEAVDVIKSENEKKDEANETSLKFSFRMLAQMAPDVFEVVVDTLMNPIAGISTVVRKIAERAKAERASS